MKMIEFLATQCQIMRTNNIAVSSTTFSRPFFFTSL